MPDFANPFSQNVPPKKMSLPELTRAIRLNIAAELEATSIYEAHAEATENPLARKVLLDIANEERVHVGEFTQLLKILLSDEQQWLEIGSEEVDEMAAEVARGDVEPATPAEKAAEEGASGDGAAREVELPTIGSMRQ